MSSPLAEAVHVARLDDPAGPREHLHVAHAQPQPGAQRQRLGHSQQVKELQHQHVAALGLQRRELQELRGDPQRTRDPQRT